MSPFRAAGGPRCPAGAPLVSRVAEARPDQMIPFRAAGAPLCPAGAPPVPRRCPDDGDDDDVDDDGESGSEIDSETECEIDCEIVCDIDTQRCLPTHSDALMRHLTHF
eukprot:9478688-Pyramimonas_sp.AAC.1